MSEQAPADRIQAAVYAAWAKEERVAQRWDEVCAMAAEGYIYAARTHRMIVSVSKAAVEAAKEVK